MAEDTPEEKPGITTEFVAGQQSVVLGILTHLQADMRANHRENSSKMDTVLASIPLMQSDIGRAHHRITGLETEVKPVVEAHKRRLMVRAAWASGVGAALGSPWWAPKLVAILQAAFP